MTEHLGLSNWHYAVKAETRASAGVEGGGGEYSYLFTLSCDISINSVMLPNANYDTNIR